MSTRTVPPDGDSTAKKQLLQVDQCANELLTRARYIDQAPSARRQLYNDALAAYRSAVQIATDYDNQDILPSVLKNAAITSFELGQCTSEINPNVAVAHYRAAIEFFEKALDCGHDQSVTWVTKLKNGYLDCTEKALELITNLSAREMLTAAQSYLSVIRQDDVRYMCICTLVLRLCDVIKDHLEGDECEIAQEYINKCHVMTSETRRMTSRDDTEDLEKLEQKINFLSTRCKTLQTIITGDSLFTKTVGADTDREFAYSILGHYRNGVAIAKGALPREIGRAYLGMAKVYSELLDDRDKAMEHKTKATLVISKSSQRLSRGDAATADNAPLVIHDVTVSAQTPPVTSNSVDLRNQGNIQFKAAHELATEAEMQPFLDKALTNYYEALAKATTADENASAAKNAGATANKLAEISNNSKAKLGHYKDAMANYACARSQGIKARKSSQWLASLNESTIKCLDVCLEVVTSAPPRDACDTVEYILDMVDDDTVRYKCQKTLAVFLLEHIEGAILSGRSAVALTMLKDCKDALNDAVILASSEERPYFSKMQGDVIRLSKEAVAIRELEIVDELLSETPEVVFTDEFICDVIDRYQKVITMGKNYDFATTGLAYYGLAMLYQNILQNKERAREYLQKAKDHGTDITMEISDGDDVLQTSAYNSVTVDIPPNEVIHPSTKDQNAMFDYPTTPITVTTFRPKSDDIQPRELSAIIAEHPVIPKEQSFEDGMLERPKEWFNISASINEHSREYMADDNADNSDTVRSTESQRPETPDVINNVRHFEDEIAGNEGIIIASLDNEIATEANISKHTNVIQTIAPISEDGVNEKKKSPKKNKTIKSKENRPKKKRKGKKSKKTATDPEQARPEKDDKMLVKHNRIDPPQVNQSVPKAETEICILPESDIVSQGIEDVNDEMTRAIMMVAEKYIQSGQEDRKPTSDCSTIRYTDLQSKEGMDSDNAPPSSVSLACTDSDNAPPSSVSLACAKTSETLLSTTQTRTGNDAIQSQVVDTQDHGSRTYANEYQSKSVATAARTKRNRFLAKEAVFTEIDASINRRENTHDKPIHNIQSRAHKRQNGKDNKLNDSEEVQSQYVMRTRSPPVPGQHLHDDNAKCEQTQRPPRRHNTKKTIAGVIPYDRRSLEDHGVPDMQTNSRDRHISVPDIQIDSRGRHISVPDMQTNSRGRHISVPDIQANNQGHMSCVEQHIPHRAHHPEYGPRQHGRCKDAHHQSGPDESNNKESYHKPEQTKRYAPENHLQHMSRDQHERHYSQHSASGRSSAHVKHHFDNQRLFHEHPQESAGRRKQTPGVKQQQLPEQHQTQGQAKRSNRQKEDNEPKQREYNGPNQSVTKDDKQNKRRREYSSGLTRVTPEKKKKKKKQGIFGSCCGR